MTRLAMLVGVCGLVALPLEGSERLALHVTPAVAFAPTNVRVRATVESDAANRAIEIAAESAGFYRSSRIQLDGLKAPRTNMFEFRGLPAGTYEVSAALIDSTGQRVIVRRQVNVIGADLDQ